MISRDIRLSSEDRRMLFNVKNTIGIEHFYTSCRWAFCLSLDSENAIKKLDSTSDSAVEISWERFGGKDAEVYFLLLKDEARRLDLEDNEDNLYDLLISHIRRGLGYLTGNKELKSLEALTSRAFKQRQLELIKS
tara:strand:+ start:675 stop:1079 length:405 start_codon:yes stop_codon:yes gene_type:complete